MKRILFDIEADNYIDDVTKIHCIVAKDIDTNEVYRFRPTEIEEGLQLLKNADMLLGHNILDYDIRVIKKLYPTWDTQAYLYDTLIAAKVAFADIKERDFAKLSNVIKKPANQRTEIEKMRMRNIGRHSLEAYGLRMGKHKGTFGNENGFDEYSEEMLAYCEQDVEVNHELYNRIDKQEVPHEALDTEFETQKICLRQAETGFSFDIDKANSFLDTLESEKSRLGKLISDELGGHFLISLGVHIPKRTIRYKDLTRGNTYAGAAYTKIKFKEFNPNSRYDIATRLQERLGWKPKDFGADVKPTLNETILAKMKYPIAKVIAEYLMIDKRLGMLSNGNQSWFKLYNPETKAIHGRVNTLGTNTSRCSHYNPNLAQIPAVRAPYGKESRSLFRAPKDMKLFGTDASGLELRMLAHYMSPFDNGVYADVVLNGDVHSKNQEAAGLPTRNIAKTFIYAKIYGSGITNLAKTCNMSVKDMKKIVANFDNNLPALSRLTDAVKGVVRTRGYIKALDGRKIFCNSEHAALNYLLQSGGAIVCKNWMIDIHRQLKDRDPNYEDNVKQLAFVHDELQIAYNPDYITHEELDAISKKAMHNTQQKLRVKIKLDSDSSTGDNYAETH